MRLSAKTIDRENLSQVLRYILHNNFYAYCKFMDYEYYSDDKPHLKTICTKLQDVSDGKITKLAMSLPPRAGKSYTVSLFVTWLIGKGKDNPDTSIMRNSYGATLANKFSYDIREITQSNQFLQVFPGVQLKQDHKSIEDWAIVGAKQSTYFCSGVGGAITGKGCKTVAILDDPIKNLEDALSETILDKTWGWYTSTHKSRMETGCPEIQIATRWSNKDPIGKILADQDGWEVIVIPALDDNGKSFCEKVKTTKEYLELKNILDEFVWEAEFMQNPIEAKGLLFPESELNRFALTELNLEAITSFTGYTDTADEGTDYLASVSAALDNKNNVYIIDVVYSREQVEITEPLVAQKIIESNQSIHTIESNNGGKQYARNIKKLIKDVSRCVIKWVRTSQNKETKILMNSGQVKQYFHFRNDYEPGSEYDLFMRHLTSYVKMGKNKNDDAADVLAMLAEKLFNKKAIGFLSTK